MKKEMNRALTLMTLFMGIIGICAAALVCFILIYTAVNGSFYPKSSVSSQNASIAQANNVMDQSATIPQNTYPNSNVSASFEEQDPQIPVVPQTQSGDSNIPPEYISALNKANDYSSIMYMSKAGIYDQLVSEYGENFSSEAAQYATDNMIADWNANALQKAKDYSETMHMSKASIYDQLISDYGEKFTQAEAQYAVDNLAADYNSNALQKAKEYQSIMNMSPSEIHEQLISEYGEKFTQAEADYAIDHLETESTSAETNSSSYTTSQNNQEVSNEYYTAEVQPVYIDNFNQTTNNSSSSGNADNFNTYNNPEQQNTTATYVLNTNEDRKKIHYPTCSYVKQIAPQNYATSNLSLNELISQGYTTCGHCFQ